MARDNGGMKTGEKAADTSPERSFREALAAAIEATGTSQEELARRVGRTGGAVSQWLKKGDIPDLAIVFKIEDALDLRLGTLVRLHSPDVWVIIEVKTSGRHTWKSGAWEQKFREALIEAPLNQMQRKIVKDTAEQFAAFNVASRRGPEPQ